MKNIVVVLTLILLAGCKNDLCPAFPECLIGFFPYDEVEEVQFINNYGDTLRLQVKECWYWDSYEMDLKDVGRCYSAAAFALSMDTVYNISINGSIELVRNTADISIYFKHQKQNLDRFKFAIDSINRASEEIDIDTIYFINESYNRFNEVCLVLNSGVVSFKDSELDCTWIFEYTPR